MELVCSASQILFSRRHEHHWNLTHVSWFEKEKFKRTGALPCNACNQQNMIPVPQLWWKEEISEKEIKKKKRKKSKWKNKERREMVAVIYTRESAILNSFPVPGCYRCRSQQGRVSAIFVIFYIIFLFSFFFYFVLFSVLLNFLFTSSIFIIQHT